MDEVRIDKRDAEHSVFCWLVARKEAAECGPVYESLCLQLSQQLDPGPQAATRLGIRLTSHLEHHLLDVRQHVGVEQRLQEGPGVDVTARTETQQVDDILQDNVVSDSAVGLIVYTLGNVH